MTFDSVRHLASFSCRPLSLLTDKTARLFRGLELSSYLVDNSVTCVLSSRVVKKGENCFDSQVFHLPVLSKFSSRLAFTSTRHCNTVYLYKIRHCVMKAFYQAIDLWRDIPHHVKVLFQRNRTLFAVRTIIESNLHTNFIIKFNSIYAISFSLFPMWLSFFLIKTNLK